MTGQKQLAQIWGDRVGDNSVPTNLTLALAAKKRIILEDYFYKKAFDFAPENVVKFDPRKQDF